MIIGLTGHSGAGKSTVAQMFAEDGFFISDCDKISHSLDSFKEYQKAILEAFGRTVFENGEISRKKLGTVVFENKEKLKALSDIAHPIIARRVSDEIENCKNDRIVIDAPLLLDSSLKKMCDFTVGIVADDELRISRIMERDNITKEYAIKRIRSQHPKQYYYDNCDYVIDNNESLDVLKQHYHELMSKIRGIEQGETKK